MTNIGEITILARIDTGKLSSDATKVNAITKKVGNDTGNNVEAGSSRASSALSKLTKVAKVAAVATGAALAAGIIKASKASWDQVAAVQQATVGLRAYEKDGAKVNAVLKSLITYARSDMGVLFNRKDLFQSAQMLKLNGVQTKDLSKNVQILSRSVGLGLGNWQDLNSVVGRVVATGRLSGIEFDQLTQYGFKLDKSLRNTNLSAEELFKALDKGIPVDAMKGQAETIRGIGVRMESAFRGVGDAILGVDADTSKFIKGGLGDTLVKGALKATDALKTIAPAAGSVSKGLLDTAKSVYKNLSPSLKELGTSISSRLLPAMQSFISSPFVATLGGIFVSAARLAIQALTSLADGMANFIRQVSGATPILLGLSAGYIAYQAVLLATTAKTTALAAAQTALNIVMRLNPFALLVAGAVGIVTAYASVVSSTNNNTAASDRLKAAKDRLKLATDGVRSAEQLLNDARLAQAGTALGVERAQLSYNQAVRQFGPASLEAREALHNLRVAEANHKTAVDRTKNATNEAKKAMKERAAAAGEVINASRRISGEVNSESQAWLGLGKSINEARSAAGKGPVRGGHIKVPTGFNIPGRSSGGTVSKNQPYFVGENRDGSLNKTSELFVPNSSGRIMNSSNLQKALQNAEQSSGGGGIVNNINTINVASDVDADRLLQRLTNNSEVISKGLTPTRSYL